MLPRPVRQLTFTGVLGAWKKVKGTLGVDRRGLRTYPGSGDAAGSCNAGATVLGVSGTGSFADGFCRAQATATGVGFPPSGLADGLSVAGATVLAAGGSRRAADGLVVCGALVQGRS